CASRSLLPGPNPRGSALAEHVARPLRVCRDHDSSRSVRTACSPNPNAPRWFFAMSTVCRRVGLVAG
ncbi:hypothetical protein OAO87_00600, partial [bacterium]|nr:hypothetical protein [bacterium]